jgi:hypothetical protein
MRVLRNKYIMMIIKKEKKREVLDSFLLRKFLIIFKKWQDEYKNFVYFLLYYFIYIKFVRIKFKNLCCC